MGEQRKQRSKNIQRRYDKVMLNKLFLKKLHILDAEKLFLKLVGRGIIKETKDGENESVCL